MHIDGRNFITFAEDSHPLLQEIPKHFRDIWFHSYQHNETGERLFLKMERIFEYPNNTDSNYADLLTFEVASLDDLLEWEEDHGEKEFIALEPDYIFFDGLIDEDIAQLSIGSLDRKTMDFTTDIEIFVSLTEDGIIIDYQDDDDPVYWKLIRN
ncbi:MAG: hypothetical protein ACRCTJ_01885 [Brevinema sp.]